MINTIKHLCYVLRMAKDDLDHMLEHLDRYYYETESTKTKYGGPQEYNNGVKKVRILHPSTGKLKAVQKKIYKNILSKLPIDDYAYGSIKGKNNILNAKQHIGNRYFLSADLKNFFRRLTTVWYIRLSYPMDFHLTWQVN